MIKTYRQIQRARSLRAHALPAPTPLPLLQQPGYSDLAHSPAFVLTIFLALLVLVLDLGGDQLGLQWLYALARLTGGAA